eukprot:SAG22_NODE_7335_length_750_cov_1.043011_1_plen_93_part_10
MAEARGRAVALALKKEIRRQLFVISIQAAVGGKVVAAEKIPAYRKDVLTKSGKTVGGGDVTRKKKLLQKQAKVSHKALLCFRQGPDEAGWERR